MAKNIRKHSDKMAAVCPHCGFTQEESVAAKSTFCRKCQQHYNLERMLAGEKSIVKEPSLFSKLTRLVMGDRQREVTCFTCHHKQTLSKEAQSTMCPGCGAYMDLRDFKIAGPFGRSVQTAGDVHVTAKGDVTSTRLLCGMLYLEGSVRGSIICTGVATLRFKGRMGGAIDAPHIMVDKKGDVDFPRPVHTKLFEVNGKATGAIVADKVIINKGGWLEGSVHAKAITVDKGGVFAGDLNISTDIGEGESSGTAEVAAAGAVDRGPTRRELSEVFEAEEDVEPDHEDEEEIAGETGAIEEEEIAHEEEEGVQPEDTEPEPIPEPPKSVLQPSPKPVNIPKSPLPTSQLPPKPPQTGVLRPDPPSRKPKARDGELPLE